LDMSALEGPSHQVVWLIEAGAPPPGSRPLTELREALESSMVMTEVVDRRGVRAYRYQLPV
ncbi:MAG: hypothetical protein ACRDHY_00580, partial [Anaerolineales bacterium]